MPIETTISIEHVLEVLNEALERDRVAVSKLFLHRVGCNDHLAEHPTIQIGNSEDTFLKSTGKPTSTVSALGILNGLFGVDYQHWGTIAANVGEGGLIDSFVDLGRR